MNYYFMQFASSEVQCSIRLALADLSCVPSEKFDTTSCSILFSGLGQRRKI
jgi:hypothetical protein